MTGSGVDEGKKYIAFVRGNMDQIDKKITDDLWALSAIEVCEHIVYVKGLYSSYIPLYPPPQHL